MRTILVTGASGIVGYGILKSLESIEEEKILIGSSIFEDTIAEAFCNIFVKAIPSTDPKYIDWLVNTISKYKIDLIIPGIEIDMQTWAMHYERLSNTGVNILLNKLDLISLCKDKWTFYQYMIENNLPYKIMSSLSNNFDTLKKELGFPFLIKPKQGYGSKGIVKIENIETFERYKTEIGKTLMVQSFVGSEEEEYSTSAFCDKDGNLISFLSLKRKLSKDGFTEKAKVVFDKEIEDAIILLCKHFKPEGPTNFQFRKDKKGLMLLEINPRISSATSIRSSFGYNETKLYIDSFLENKKIKNILIKKGKAIRYTEDYIVYE